MRASGKRKRARIAERSEPELPEILKAGLEARKAVDPEAEYTVTTRATCTNRRLGSLFARYSFDELDEPGRLRFEQHVRTCISCAADVHNDFVLRRLYQRERSRPRST